MSEKMAKRIRGHSALEPGEDVIDAWYGFGKRMLDRSRFSELSEKMADAKVPADGGGSGTRIDCNGMLVLTDRRILFLPMKLAVSKPKEVAGAWSLDQVVGADYLRNIVAIGFTDGSIGSLHFPRAEKPLLLVEAVNARARGGATSG